MEGSEEKRPETKINIPVQMQLIYINGGNIALTPTDIQITGTMNGRPQALIVMPFSTAKGIVDAMTRAIREYEEKTGNKVLDTNQLAASFKK